MAIKQISERIIRNNYTKLDNMTKSPIHHMESDLYYYNDIIYKILNKSYRFERYKNMYLLTNLKFSNAANIIDELFQGDKFIGFTMNYIKDFITLSEYMEKLDLYEVKIIMEKLIYFYKETLNNSFLYWDNHLNNIGLSDNELFVMDIDSMIYNPSDKEIKYALNNLLTLFYELALKKHLRNDYDNYIDYVFNFCKNIKYLEYNLNIKDIENIINDTSQDFIDEKKQILKKV